MTDQERALGLARLGELAQAVVVAKNVRARVSARWNADPSACSVQVVTELDADVEEAERVLCEHAPEIVALCTAVLLPGAEEAGG